MADNEGQKKTERLHMLISPDELEAIDEWRFKNRIGTRAEAIRRLVQIALSLEPLVKDLPDMAREVRGTDVNLRRSVLEAKNILDQEREADPKAAAIAERVLLPLDVSSLDLDRSSTEFLIHADAMQRVFDGLRSGETIEESIQQVKDALREQEKLRQFARRDLGDEE